MTTYEFVGVHFLASYVGCQNNLTDIESLRTAMTEAVNASGATILGMNEHIFKSNLVPPLDGYTAVYVLSESHASIHTYPENESCFVDLFTCGENCSYERFNEILQKYLQPKKINSQVIRRDATVNLLLDDASINH